MEPPTPTSKVVDPEGEWRAARSRDLLERHLPGVMLVVALGEALMALRNLLVLQHPANWIMAGCQLAVAVLALLSWSQLRRHDYGVDELQRHAAAGLALIGLLMPLEMALTGQGLLAANTALMIVVAGATLLSHRAFAAVTLLLIVGWALALTTQGAWAVGVADQATLMLVGTFVAVLVHWNRTVDRRALVRNAERALEAGLHDELTGLWNRRGGREVWSVLAAGAHEAGIPMWCIFLDVRGLKRVNDLISHEAGDRLLSGVACALGELSPPGVVAARWGGDEFCLFGAGDTPDAVELAHDVQARAQQMIGQIDQPWGITCGLAVGDADPGQDALWRLVSDADDDMYRRRSGPSGIVG
ncbi:MAG: GGDEF domain-containing protein [Actinobacteria bacterium]|nr:MAG: GGDEF domain-containing protein [Actinomycetota bacterium]